MKRTQTKRQSIFGFAMVAAFAATALVTAPLGSYKRAAAEDAEQGTVATQAVESPVRNAEVRDSEPLDKFTLRIFYYRPDGDYTGWNMWIWGAGGGGDYTTNDESSPGMFQREIIRNDKKCAYLSIDIENATPSGNDILGLIVRKSESGNWWAKQSSNMYVATDKIKVGEKNDIYIVQDIDKVYYDMNEALSDKVTSALFKENKGATTVEIATNAVIKSTTVFEVRDGEGNVKGTLDCTQNGKYVNLLKAEIPFDGEVDFGSEYTVVDTSAEGFSEAPVLKHKLYDTQNFIDKYSYDGELGVKYAAEQSEFRVWSPVASDMKLYVYDDDTTATHATHDMTRGTKGDWSVTVNGDLNGKYYTYYATVNGNSTEVVDPYATSGGKNGNRGMVLDLDATDPDGWATQSNPQLESYSQAVIYEAQLRDLTIHESSNVSANNRGKFLGLTEKGTADKPTPLDYIKSLGVTAVHFQPLFDFASVDESFSVATYNKDGEYNWGYDPKNYNMPDGSYSSDPTNGATRVNEMKQMVMALHNEGVQVIMDVVYNHMASASDSPFETLMPGYYFRLTDSGAYFNGSGCGNETASERAMFRKFMIDSCKYWAQEYNIDGFRFDLMGLHDIDTMNMLYDAVAEINPDVIIYGEGWNGGTSGIADDKAALQRNAKHMPNIGVFNDIIRDGLKGSVFTMSDTGFVSGKYADAAVYVGAAGSTSILSESDYKTLGNDKEFFALNPTQSINYVSAHDNSALWDKLNASVNASPEVLKSMQRLAATSVLTSQGASFMLAGEELLRSKPTDANGIADYDNRATQYVTDPTYYFSDNSYKSPDSVNAIRWTSATENADMVEFYKGLIGIKKTFPMFQIATRAELETCLTINDSDLRDGVAAYAVKDPASNEYAVVILNSLDKAREVSVPNGNYKVFVKGSKSTADKSKPLSTVKGASVNVPARSAMVMTAELNADSVSAWTYSVKNVKADESSNGLAIGLGVGIPVGLLVICGAVFAVLFLKKKSGKAAASDKVADEVSEEKTDSADEQPVEDQPEETSEPVEEQSDEKGEE